MEDEIASIAAVIGASMGGVKAMTATSGPGFSLKQENIGYAAGAEIPCVIVNVMRGGPSHRHADPPGAGATSCRRAGAATATIRSSCWRPPRCARSIDETIRAFDLAETLPHRRSCCSTIR